MLADTRQRGLRDLRLSVTDRCNFRCRYCMPRESFGPGFRFLPQHALLSFEELALLARVFVGLGVRKLRITGGEPLLRRDLPRLIERLPRHAPGATAGSPDPIDVALTTNGSLLAAQAEALRRAGLSRVTVSLDALDPERFELMSDSRVPVERVLEGIEEARRVGLQVKVNSVIRRGANDDQVLPLVRHFRATGIPLRFIEYMDVGNTNGWRQKEVVPARALLAQVQAQFPLRRLPAAHPGEVAQRYAYADGRGELGIIASVTEPFCGDCNRARLSVVGMLYTCLFATRGHDLGALLRGGASEPALARAISSIWRQRSDAYSEQRGRPNLVSLRRGPRVEMSHIGG